MLSWIWIGLGGNGDLGITKKQINISVDVTSTSVLWEVFLVPVDLINAA